MRPERLPRSRALWNRSRLELASDETLAQLMDRGEIEVWRELFELARTDADLRRRMLGTVRTVPLALPHFWLALLAELGEEVDHEIARLQYDDGP